MEGMSLSNISNTSSSKQGISDYAMKIIFSIISISSIVPNVLFLMAMFLNYSRMRSGYHNILLYNIMISDTLAGSMILVTPNILLPEDFVEHPAGLEGQIYCRVLYSQYLLFVFGVISVYTVVFLSIERWCAVQYPFKYRTNISSTKVKLCVLVIWSLGLLANAPHLSELRPGQYNSTKSCQWKYKKYQTRQIVAFLEICFKFILPSLVLILVLISLYKRFRRQENSSRSALERQLLRMCAATSFTVLLCWSPNQIYYLLYKFEVVRIGTTFHHVTVVVALSTSSINPIIYFLTSTAYRQCLLIFLRNVFKKCTLRPRITRTFPLVDIEATNTTNQRYRRNQTFDGPLFTCSSRMQSDAVASITKHGHSAL